ncbi:hypothetical protein MELA_02059 [Candidatus Methylomirabilis lanthanidiphila]|uniref:Uncharacterized protein n=1 Tax=Candidatus Methylomirabilis lanthanidiphila TaxID=2211376 RepID=A0A564ZK48_9BACT|nr:hypothetical protein [Candidatus Methylomirabilis lanthanidiphila]VUZ85674.1 hypothetical protein MELA_02059 [Candidatus Methylomirabilis lanthanidiphila]
MSRVNLEPEQEQLFRDLVEAERRVPRPERVPFIILNTLGPAGVQLAHPGWINTDRRIFEGDIDTLARVGLIVISYPSPRLKGFYVPPEGFAYYGEMMRRRGEPVQRVQVSIREYIQSHAFQSRYRSAYAKWQEAENLLWSDDSDKALTTIGHLLREAMQEFATALVERFRPPNVEADKARTVSRIRAVLNAQKLGDKVRAFLDALIIYWGTVSDLVQRQEHGALREGEPLKWIDARRVVFQTAIVMLEIDAALAI